jgi:UDP-N-acetylbacillosamine N-acetyltransferase
VVSLNITNNILIFGFGGHARSVADVVIKLGINKIIFIDEYAKDGETFANFPVLRSIPTLKNMEWSAFAASGNDVIRKEQIYLIKNLGFQLFSIIAKSATVGFNCTISSGVFVGEQAHIGPNSLIQEGAIINTAAIIEHDCQIGSYSHISVNATIAGNSKIGDSCFIGTGATVIDKIKITNNCTVGAGSTVIKDITSSGIHVGSPAVRIK